MCLRRELVDVVLELVPPRFVTVRELDTRAFGKRVLADAAGIAPRDASVDLERLAIAESAKREANGAIYPERDGRMDIGAAHTDVLELTREEIVRCFAQDVGFGGNPQELDRHLVPQVSGGARGVVGVGVGPIESRENARLLFTRVYEVSLDCAYARITFTHRGFRCIVLSV